MMNIIRGGSPSSLLETQYTTFKTQAQAFSNDTTGTLSAPNETGLSYRQTDVYEAFNQRFHCKCYLTEEKFSSSNVMDIDHFIPVNERLDLKFDWSNLFPATGYANGRRRRVTPTGGFLNPCDPTHDVENEIICSIPEFYGQIFFTPRDNSMQIVVNTCEELERIHNGTGGDATGNTLAKSKELRHAIHKKISLIATKIIEWRTATGNEKVSKQRELTELLSRKNSFTMAVRSTDLVKAHIPTDFLD